MKAIVYSAAGEFAYKDVPDPKITDDEVLIRVKACGLCRTDMHIHEGNFIAEFPLINGHEFAGEITEIGANVTGLTVGDAAVADNTVLCGTCYYCKKDQPWLCESFGSHGCNLPGGFAEYIAVRAEKVFKINSQNLSWREAVMAEPTACAMHGMDIIDLSAGSEVLIFGAGPTALILAQLLKHNGAARLVAAAPAGRKLELMKKLAADDVVEIDKSDPQKHRTELLKISPNGFDTVVEATGVPSLFGDAFHHARKGGQIIAYGVYPEDAKIPVSPSELFMKELTVKGSFCQTHCFGRAVMYLDTKLVKVDEIVTHEIPLKNYGQALKLMDERKAIKIAIVP